MTDLATVSNATFESAAALVPPPFGPLTRVGSLESTPRALPNSVTPIAVTGQGSVPFLISYNDMQNEGVRNRIIAEAYGVNYLFVQMFQHIKVLYFQMAAESNLLTASKTQLAPWMRMLKTLPAFMANSPYRAFIEVDKNKKVRARFTVSGTGANRTVVNTTTGEALYYLWEWGDGTTSILKDPPTKTYAADGTYIIKLYAIGPGGEDQWQISQVVDVP